MNVRRRIVFSAAASWVSRGVSIVLGLVLMPVLFGHLAREELGLWLVLGQSWAAMGVLDLGLSFTLTRRIALAKGRSGGATDAALTDESRREIADLVESCRRIYGWVGLAGLLAGSAAGYFYLHGLHLGPAALGRAWLGWTILCAGQAIGLRSAVWSCLLQGTGWVGWDALVSCAVAAATVCGQICAALLGGGLLSLALAAAAGAVVQRRALEWLARRRRPELVGCGRWNGPLVRGLVAPSLRAWVTSLGAMLVIGTDGLLIASLSGAGQVPGYRAAYVLVHNVNILAVTFGLASGVFISQMWQAGEVARVQRLVARNTRLGLLVMLSAAAVLLTAGETVFELWLGRGQFIGYAVLGTMLVSETLEAHSYILASSSRATEDEAFAVTSVTAGVLNVALSLVLATRFGLPGIALGTMIALLLTNHWYMPVRGLARLRLGWREYLLSVLVPCGLAFVALVSALLLVREATAGAPAVVRLAAIGAAALAVFGIAAWRLVLEPGPLTPSLSPSEGERVPGGRVRGSVS